MFTNKFLWAIYTSSYFFDYILLLLLILFKNMSPTNNRWMEYLFYSIPSSSYFLHIVVLVILIILSIICTIKLKNIKMNTKISVIPKTNITTELISSLFPQGVTILSLFYTNYWELISIFIFVSIGIIFVKSKKVYLNPLFVFPLGYSLYQSEEIVLITNYSVDEMRLCLEMNPNGINAREVARNVFIVKKD